MSLRLLDSGSQIGMYEIVALVEQGFALVAGQCVTEAVAEVEVGRVAAATSVVAIGLAGDPGLLGGDRLNGDS